MTLGRIMAVAIMVGLGISRPTMAAADEGDQVRSSTLIETSNGEEGPEARVTGIQSVGTTVRGPGAPAWLRACSWLPVTLLGKETYYTQFGATSPTSEELVAAGKDPDELWAVVFCRPGPEALGLSPSVLLTGVLASWRIGDRPPQIFFDWLVAMAYASVEIPVQVGDAAPFGDEQAPMITQLPTWLWIDQAVWSAQSATTDDVFGVTVTVTATPSWVFFTDGHEERVNCGSNHGPPYDFTRSEESQHSACVLTYHHSSAVGDWELTSTIVWDVAYTCQPQCGTGVLPDYVVTNSRPVRVAELQAVLLGPGE